MPVNFLHYHKEPDNKISVSAYDDYVSFADHHTPKIQIKSL